jgi:adenylyltransferase/sulfurtransferase
MELSEEQIIRYSRNIVIREMGGVGQQKLLKSKVLVVGAGGLGSPVLSYLAAAGTGKIGIIDSDSVHASNLNRQVVHSLNSINTPKVESARKFINLLNPDVNVEIHHTRLTIDNVLELIAPYDYIVDCMDTLPLKFLLNDACIELKKPFFHAGIVAFYGQILSVNPGKSACLRCLFPEMPDSEFGPTCAEAGILGACAGIMGSLQACEVIKSVLGLEVLFNRLLVFEGISTTFKEIKLEKNPACPVCSTGQMLPAIHYEITRHFCD